MMSEADVGHTAPDGADFFERTFEIELDCQLQSLVQIPEMGKKAPQCYKELAASTVILDLVASCNWGCRNEDHVLEYTIGRATNLIRGAIRLMLLGFYDEALALSRNLGEIANLLSLFGHDSSQLESWKQTDRLARMRKFKPVKVRLLLEQIGTPLRIENSRYSTLSELATHVTPQTVPGNHNPIGMPVLGGRYQPEGLLLCLNETALPTVFVLYATARLMDFDKEEELDLLNAARRLIDVTGGFNVDQIEEISAKRKINWKD